MAAGWCCVVCCGQIKEVVGPDQEQQLWLNEGVVGQLHEKVDNRMPARVRASRLRGLSYSCGGEGRAGGAGLGSRNPRLSTEGR